MAIYICIIRFIGSVGGSSVGSDGDSSVGSDGDSSIGSDGCCCC